MHTCKKYTEYAQQAYPKHLSRSWGPWCTVTTCSLGLLFAQKVKKAFSAVFLHLFTSGSPKVFPFLCSFWNRSLPKCFLSYSLWYRPNGPYTQCLSRLGGSKGCPERNRHRISAFRYLATRSCPKWTDRLICGVSLFDPLFVKVNRLFASFAQVGILFQSHKLNFTWGHKGGQQKHILLEWPHSEARLGKMIVFGTHGSSAMALWEEEPLSTLIRNVRNAQFLKCRSKRKPATYDGSCLMTLLSA